MRDTSCANGFDAPVVQEWVSGAGAPVPSPFEGPNAPPILDVWHTLSKGDQQSVIENEVLRNGIQRPVGHTVSFHYNPRVESHHFGKSHPMKPWRLTLTKQLVLSYGLHYALDLYRPLEATKEELAAYHTREYLDFLQSIDPQHSHPSSPNTDHEQRRTAFLGSNEANADCPVFDGMWGYFTLYAGASLDAAHKLVADQSDIAINWSGGLHHAHKGTGAGFCYINDIVLAIQQLLLVTPRVLYIDIDVHHGDGVEEAFYYTDRVLTLSFHKYGETFFPGTGALEDTGPRGSHNPGAHHSLNVPLRDGIEDAEWERLFRQIAGDAIDTYNPGAIVLQCGADSLGGDRLGSFNINIRAHGFAVEFVKSRAHGRKMMIVGGGGYTPRNVARCWTHETSIAADVELRNELPMHVPYRQAFTGNENGDGLLYPSLSNIQGKIHPNMNDQSYFDNLIAHNKEQLRYIKGGPSVQMSRIPIDHLRIREEVDEALRDELEDRDRDEMMRRRREKNYGYRGERLSS
ncbi:putative histone deacetylase [Trichodelitschia bisporula]|uniref:Histone deacetylase n=1 Tax=Trichodelitschia bisporula TaxID=703511 RepID=A0A6G1I7K7_9PEZI|nr:putative histone deacetylase [Trichodelitschia bisporula]